MWIIYIIKFILGADKNMVGIFNIMDFLKSEKEIAERLDGILTTWDSTPEIKTAKGKGQISYEQQEPGSKNSI